MTRRSVVWLGQTCNLRCYFCYFVNRIADPHHPEHAFMKLDKAKAICQVLRDFYRDTSIDIQGGEPTIYPRIIELVQYCRDIGLHPTLITNGLFLSKAGKLEAYRSAGVRDFLVSLHGLGETHDQVVGREGAYEEITKSIERMREVGIPFRFNCTMSEPVVPLLPEIARKAIDYGAYVVNYIAFNPFGDQTTGHRTAKNVPRYADIKVALTKAIDLLEEAGIEVNVRYLPLCIAEPRHRKNFYNFQQLSYDTHEWNFESWLWTMMGPQMGRPDIGPGPTPRIGWGAAKIYRPDGSWTARMLEGGHRGRTRAAYTVQHLAARANAALCGRDAVYRAEARVRAAQDCHYRYHDVCERCGAKAICDGFHGDYAEFFGTDEACAITDIEPTDDPRFFIREQEKFVEIEDRDWAL
ncbi:MAG TPA: radical SAM protein [Candidatus Hydrogenedentes bacterium]|nr:radical SAM protein [Candidatus Hydrogenedentota bacterium]